MTIPQHLKESFDRYVEQGVPPGHFLKAVLANDLMWAIGRADSNNLAILKDIVAYVKWKLPSDCHGSWKTVEKWETDHLHRELTTEGKPGGTL